MPESPNASRLLALLEAGNMPGFDPDDPFDDISNELHESLTQFAMSTLVDAESWTPEEEERMVQLLTKEPRGIFLLRSLLSRVQEVEALGPVPESIIEKQKAHILGERSPKPCDFTVTLSRGRLRYTGSPPLRITQSFELARDLNENTTLLQHTQRLNHCEIKVTVETGGRQTFTITLEFNFIEPQYKRQQLTVTVRDDSASIQLSKAVSGSTVEFEDLPPGSYTVQILAKGSVIDQFRAELKLDE